jgi:hypothetical protein
MASDGVRMRVAAGSGLRNFNAKIAKRYERAKQRERVLLLRLLSGPRRKKHARAAHKRILPLARYYHLAILALKFRSPGPAAIRMRTRHPATEPQSATWQPSPRK